MGKRHLIEKIKDKRKGYNTTLDEGVDPASKLGLLHQYALYVSPYECEYIILYSWIQ